MSTASFEMEPQMLKDLRLRLLDLHKALLDDERKVYERVHGYLSGAELLQLVINDEQFAWLHSISEFIVRIDEMLDADEPASEDEIRFLLTQTQTLLTPAETGGEFQRRYYKALQRQPDV